MFAGYSCYKLTKIKEQHNYVDFFLLLSLKLGPTHSYQLQVVTAFQYSFRPQEMNGGFMDFHSEKELLVTAWVANIKMNDEQPEEATYVGF